METYKDTDNGLEIRFTPTLKDTIRGARGKFGVPEEPDEEVYSFRVDSVELYDIELDLDLKDEYEYHEEMIEDVIENVKDMIERTMQ